MGFSVQCYLPKFFVFVVELAIFLMFYVFRESTAKFLEGFS